MTHGHTNHAPSPEPQRGCDQITAEALNGVHVSQHTAYRTHHCGALRLNHLNQEVKVCGWVHRKRDHGGLIFLDIRDHYGMIQCVLEEGHPQWNLAESLSVETVVQMSGSVMARSENTRNPGLDTGDIEVVVRTLTVLSRANALPLPVNTDADYPEDIRLTYRFLDLRRPVMHQAMIMRSQIIAFMRAMMVAQGFLEIQTPILTAPSPEGARDYVVPSRLYPGEFYALPQAPQQFKQLLMASGFDKYFQIAPCFRDESSRADRSPGEFYQLDLEMAFVSQEDIWNAVEPVLQKTFEQFAPTASVTKGPFPRIPYADAMVMYGIDKPDLRNPLIIRDMTHQVHISIFQSMVEKGGVIRAVVVPGAMQQSRKFFKDLEGWVMEKGAKGLGYISHGSDGLQGPLVKFCTPETCDVLKAHVPMDGVVFFVCDMRDAATTLSGQLRTHLGQLLGLIDESAFELCWITDFPMYEQDIATGQIIFSHNPFSMPQGEMDALMHQDPLQIKAYQYDIVCNGIELSSGAIRNHRPDVMYKAFEIAGYSKEHVDQQFGAMIKAFQYGVPPHGGSAPGIDRIVMLLAGTPNIREVIPFPLNQQARDLMMGAPSPLSAERLEELHLRIIRDLGKKPGVNNPTVAV
jgi:aspartyl-tRNA synthetase